MFVGSYKDTLLVKQGVVYIGQLCYPSVYTLTLIKHESKQQF